MTDREGPYLHTGHGRGRDTEIRVYRRQSVSFESSAVPIAGRIPVPPCFGDSTRVTDTAHTSPYVR